MKDWVRLYTSAWSNPKFLGLSLEAHGLWAVGLAYSGGSEREGFVPSSLVERVTRYGCDQSVTDATTPADLSGQLEIAGLWEPVEGGWMMHNYDGRQAKDEASRDANRIRQQRFRDTRKATDNGDNAPVTRESVTSRRREEEKREEEKRTTPKPPTGAVTAAVEAFVATWNAHCGPLPTLRKTPIGANAIRLMTSAVDYFDGDLELLGAAIERAAQDPMYREKRWGFETFCRHLPSRWGEAPRPHVVGREDGYADAARFAPSAISAAYMQMDRAITDDEKAAARAAIVAAQGAAGMVAHA